MSKAIHHERSNPKGNRGSSNTPAGGKRRQESGGNMGAGRSGTEDLGSEKPSERDNMGSNKPKK